MTIKAAHLPEERRLLAAIVDSSDDAIIAKDLDGKILTWNKSAQRIFGYSEVEAVGKPISIIAAPGHDEMPRILERIRRGERINHFETVRRKKNGELVNVSLTVSPVYDAQGRIVAASKIARDITEQVRAAALRRATEERQRLAEHSNLLAEAAPNAMIMVDNEGRITLVNSQTEKLFGYRREELLGQPVEILIPLRYRRGHHALRDLFLKAPSTRAMGAGRDLSGVRKDGSEVPIEIGLNPVTTDQGDFVLAAIVDITERKKVEEAQRRLTDQAHLLTEAAPNAMIMVDDEGRITLVNSQTEKLFGYRREELRGQPVEILVPERYRRGHLNLRGSYFATPSARPMGAGRDLFGLRKNGGEVPIEIGLNPVNTDRGNFVLAAIVDITERKASEAHRETLIAELDHRVKNTLATVQAIAQQSGLSATSFEEFRRTFDARLVALSLTHNLLRAGVWQTASLREIVAAELAPCSDGDGAASQFTIAGDNVNLNPKQALAFGLGLHELVTNALKYGALSSPRGRVDISWRVHRADESARLEFQWIESNGPTVAPPLKRGFGTKFIEGGIEADLQAEVRLQFDPRGVRCTIRAPLKQEAKRL
ncbi:MAG: PAS domain S-box protein [Alphaproteobacteria bacterium]|nr:PAS domain S-box protein [Alphaproteobacteria bacterium]